MLRRNWGVSLTFGILFLVYLSTLITGTVGGDAGELQYAGHQLALTHPTGFPLHLLISYLWTHLIPVGSVAWKMNLLSAVWGASACSILAGVIGRIHRQWLGLVGGLTLGLGGVFWGEAVLADKYAFNAFWSSLVIGFAWLWVHKIPTLLADRWLYGLCAAFGFSLLHHRTMILFAPALVFWVVWYEGRKLWQQPRHTLICFLGVVLPSLIFYPLLLPWLSARANSPIEWRPTTLGGWLDWLLERHAVQMALSDTSWGDKLANYGDYLLADYTIVLVLVALLGWWHLFRHPDLRGLALGLALAFALQAGFAANSENNPRTFTFFLPSFIVLVYVFSFGLAELLEQFHAKSHLAWVAVGIIGFGIPCYQFVNDYSAHQDTAQNGEPLDLWRITLKSGDMGERLAAGLDDLPPDTVLLMDWEQLTIIWYYQQVEGLRPDLSLDYPIERLADYTNPQAEKFTTRPLCLSRHFSGGADWHYQNVGAFICLSATPHFEIPAQITRLDKILHHASDEPRLSLVGYSWAGTVFRPKQHVPLSLTWRAETDLEQDYSVSLRILDEFWQQLWQVDIQAPVMGLYPTSRWVEGEVVTDYYELTMPSQTGRYFWGVTLYDARLEVLRDIEGNPLIFGASFEVR